MNADDLHALQLLAELQRLADPTQPAALRITIRSAEGDYIGDIALPAPGAGHATQAVSAVADYAERTPTDFAPTGIDPFLEAELEEYCIGLDTDLLVSMDPREAVAAFDEVTGYGDGGQL